MAQRIRGELIVQGEESAIGGRDQRKQGRENEGNEEDRGEEW